MPDSNKCEMRKFRGMKSLLKLLGPATLDPDVKKNAAMAVSVLLEDGAPD